MKRRAISLLLCLTLLFSLLAYGAAVYAEGETGDSGLYMSKTASANDDGSFTITLEAYARGSGNISTVIEDVPTDIVLVLDQSGSMADPIGESTFTAYRNQSNAALYDHRHNGGDKNLWYPLEDGSYVSVFAGVNTPADYTPVTNGKNNSTEYGATSYYANRNELYAKVDGQWHGVSVMETLEPAGWGYNWTYRYMLWNGTIIAESTGARTVPTFTGVDDGILYIRSYEGSNTVYTFS